MLPIVECGGVPLDDFDYALTEDEGWFLELRAPSRVKSRPSRRMPFHGEMHTDL